MTGDQGPGVLCVRGTLEHGLREVTGLGGQGSERAKDEGVDRCLPETDEHERDDHSRSDDATHKTRVRLRRRDVGEELLTAELATDEIGAGVVRPHGKDQQHDPTAFGSEHLERCSGGEWRTGVTEADHEREQAHIQRSEHRCHPGAQPVAWVLACERRDRGEDDADRDQQEAAALEDVGKGSVEDDRQREHGAQRGQGGLTGGLEECEHLARRDDHDQRDRERDREAADGDDDEEHRDEDRRARRALSHPPLPPETTMAAGELEQRLVEGRRPEVGP